jgi:hypothetical protein
VPDIRYVCLSDLHFGAENSIMTSLEPGTAEVDAHRTSAAMTGLIDGLETLITRNESAVKPTLVLCGDILELALGNDNVAAMVFSDFIGRTLGSGNQLFDDLIYFVPGNHDHHLWESARERQYADYVQARPLNEDLEIPWHTTRMRATHDPQPVDSQLLTTLIHRQLGNTAATVRAVYPNLALSSADSSRCVIFHHGHFVEAMYKLMSTIKDMLFPSQPTADEIWDWETENFAWIDFFWSTLGRSGAFGSDVGFIYDTLQSPAAMKPLLRNLAQGVTNKSRGPRWLHRIEAGPLAWALDRLASRASRLERNQPGAALAPRSRVGLQTYLDLPLRSQILAEFDSVPAELTFVFGHTHKPFEELQPANGYPAAIKIYNTGGWVVDTVKPNPLQGAAAILFDETLDALSLRLYNQTPDGKPSGVQVATTTGALAGPFAKRISDIVDANSQAWTQFSTAAATLVRERHTALSTILARGASE